MTSGVDCGAGGRVGGREVARGVPPGATVGAGEPVLRAGPGDAMDGPVVGSAEGEGLAEEPSQPATSTRATASSSDLGRRAPVPRPRQGAGDEGRATLRGRVEGSVTYLMVTTRVLNSAMPSVKVTVVDLPPAVTDSV